jgi:chromosome partition protein MukE
MDVISDERFPRIDVDLRRGKHVGRDEPGEYHFIDDAFDLLQDFYGRFEARLMRRDDGYFYLLPTSDLFPKRLLSPAEMLVGQILALLYLEGAGIEHSQEVSTDMALRRLTSLVPVQELARRFRPATTRSADAVLEKNVRKEFQKALRSLARLGFGELSGDRFRLRKTLLRFADPVRGTLDESETLARLIANKELVTSEMLEETEAASDDEDEVTE